MGCGKNRVMTRLEEHMRNTSRVRKETWVWYSVAALVMAVYSYLSALIIIYPIIYILLMILAVEKVKKKFNKE